jgi:hypothetical protein
MLLNQIISKKAEGSEDLVGETSCMVVLQTNIKNIKILQI